MKIVRNVLAIILGIAVGGTINMSIISISGDVIPLPEGINPEDMDSLKAGMHRFTPINFLMPFLAHWIGTFVGALVAALIAASSKKLFAYVVGGFFLLGGIINIILLPSPLWFAFVDLAFAYIPTAWLAAKLVTKKT